MKFNFIRFLFRKKCDSQQTSAGSATSRQFSMPPKSLTAHHGSPTVLLRDHRHDRWQQCQYLGRAYTVAYTRHSTITFCLFAELTWSNSLCISIISALVLIFLSPARLLHHFPFSLSYVLPSSLLISTTSSPYKSTYFPHIFSSSETPHHLILPTISSGLLSRDVLYTTLNFRVTCALRRRWQCRGIRIALSASWVLTFSEAISCGRTSISIISKIQCLNASYTCSKTRTRSVRILVRI